MEIRISLNEEDFRQLVAGKIVEKPLEKPLGHSIVKIALQDIGWPQICDAIFDACLRKPDVTWPPISS